MELLRTRDSATFWVIGPIRGACAEPDLEAATQRAEETDSSLAAVCQLSAAWTFALTATHPEYQLADFGAAVKQFADQRGIEQLIYVECLEGAKAVTVSITTDAIVDSLDDMARLPDVIRRLQRAQKKPFKFVVSGNLEDLLNQFDNLNAETIESPLSVELLPEKAFFTSIDDALRVQRNTWILPAAVALFITVAAAVFFASQSEPPPPPPQNPHIARVDQTTRQSISVLTRANQIIDAIRQFKAVVGWELVGVNQGSNSLAYRMKPVAGGLVSELELFAKRYGYSMLREPNAADSSLLLIKEPLNTINTQDTRLYDVDNVITFITDAVAVYIPQSDITLIRATPDPSREWGTVELVIQLKEANYRYLNTLGAILVGLPASLGGGPAELAVGDLTVAGENVTGSIKLVVYGQRQNWQ